MILRRIGERQELGDLWQLELISLCVAIAIFIFGCAGTISEKDEKLSLTDEEFVASIRKQVDEQVTWQDAIDDIEKVRGKVVKWSGHIVNTSDDNIQIGDIVYSRQLRKPKEAFYGNSYIFMLDHPLPRETGIRDMSQTIRVGDAVFVIGRVIDLKAVPILKGYVISKANDRNFANPVWVGHK